MGKVTFNKLLGILDSEDRGLMGRPQVTSQTQLLITLWMLGNKGR